jgi:hypothetical protein
MMRIWMIFVVNKLLDFCFHVAKFESGNYTWIAKRIMLIGVLSIEKNFDLVTKNVLKSLELYDSKIKHIAKEFQSRGSTDSLKTEMDVLGFGDPPYNYLKDKISNYTWSKSRILDAK